MSCDTSYHFIRFTIINTYGAFMAELESEI
jgi:hypothetical protein